MPSNPDSRSHLRRFGAACVLAGVAFVLGGCNILAIPGAIAESYRRTSTHEIEAKFRGLSGKSVAVIVAAEPLIDSQHPLLTAFLTTEITNRLIKPENKTDISGFVPPGEVLQYLYNHPGWAAKMPRELGKELGDVDCLIWVEVHEFRLNDPGNQYTWNGRAVGDIGVFDLRSNTPDEYAFRETLALKFPDKPGMGPEDLSATVVSSKLAWRFIDRATWLFYNHQEAYYPEY